MKMSGCPFVVAFLLMTLSAKPTAHAYDITSDYNGNERASHATMSHTCDQVRAVPAEFRIAETLHITGGLSTFYQKYTEAYGIPVLGSQHVTDDAMKRLCYIVRFLLADNARVREEFFSWFGRVVVVAINETVLDIPEYAEVFSGDPETYTRQNAGGNYQSPLTTVSENNLLCMSNDYHPGLDVGVHEISHMLHNGGARFAIPGWNDNLTIAYDNCKANGKWNNTYSMSSSLEYFAVGVTSYFNVNKHLDEPNGVYGPISNRTALKDYDPDLYHLIEQVFPCSNSIVDRCEKDRAKENAQVLHMNCDLRRPYTPTCYDRLFTCRRHAELDYCSVSSSTFYCNRVCRHCSS